MKFNKLISLFIVLSALLICMSVVSANETTHDYMQDEVQETTYTSTDTVTTNNIKTDTKNVDKDIETTDKVGVNNKTIEKEDSNRKTIENTDNSAETVENTDNNMDTIENTDNSIEVSENTENVKINKKSDETVKTALFDNFNLTDIVNLDGILNNTGLDKVDFKNLTYDIFNRTGLNKVNLNNLTDNVLNRAGLKDLDIKNLTDTKNLDNLLNITGIKNLTKMNSTDLKNLVDIAGIVNTVKSTVNNLSNINLSSGQKFNYSVQIPKIGNYTVKIPQTVIKIDGKTIAKSRQVNGIFSLNFTVPSLKQGKHVLTIKTGATDLLPVFERNVTINIYKGNVTIKINKKASYAGENITVKANFKSGKDNVLLTKAVLKIAGKTVAKAYVINGVATFKFTTPNLRKGTYDMIVKSGSNTLYNAASKKQKFSVYRLNVTIKAASMAGLAGQKAILKAKFVSNGVKIINNTNALLKINGTTKAVSTIKDGIAVFYFNVPMIKKGTYDLLIKVGDTTFYNGASTKKKLTVYGQNITITAGSVKGKVGAKTNLVAKFVSSDNKRVSISNSVLKMNGKTLDSKAVVNGTAKYSFTIPKVDAGNYKLTIKTGDTTLYNSAVKTTKLTVI